MRYIRYGAGLALVMLMVFAAEYCGQQEIIFPEILALAVGSWMALRCPWRTTRSNLWLTPSLAAFVSILLMRYSGLPLWAMASSAFVFVALLLILTRSTLAPALSAAMLPLFIGTTSWSYPLAVTVLTALVALAVPVMDRLRTRPAQANQTILVTRQELFFWGSLLPVVTLALWLALFLDAPFAVAPPLIVTLVEFSRRRTALRRQPLRVFLLVSAAAWTGMLGYSFLSLQLGLPSYLAAGAVGTALFALYELTGLLLPPAAAIALLPMIIPEQTLAVYPWQVMAGCACLLTISLVLFPESGTQ